MAVTTIDGVNKIQIRNAKNGDFDLNLAGGGGSGGDSKPFYPIVTFDNQMQVADIQQGVVSARGGTVIIRMMGEEREVSVISTFAPPTTYRHFVSLSGILFELILNSESEITEVQTVNGRISAMTATTFTINSHAISTPQAGYVALITTDENTSEETITRFVIATGGKRAVGITSNIVVLNYGNSDVTLLYNRGLSDITFNADSELYRIE